MMMRPSTTAAPMPWRGVGIGVFEIQRFVTASYISVALKIREGASPPKTRMRSASAPAALRPRGGGQAPARRRQRRRHPPAIGGGIVDLHVGELRPDEGLASAQDPDLAAE